MVVSYICIGSNLGHKYKNILNAISCLSKIGKIKDISSVYLSSPVENIKQPYFYNCVVKIDTPLHPCSLLKSLKQIERTLGRRNSRKRYQPRIIDLDILFYGRKIINRKNLVIPHKKLHNRKFVLFPLEEIAHGVVHPVLSKKISTLKKLIQNDKTQKVELKIPARILKIKFVKN